MNVKIYALVPAMVFTLGAVTALAQTPPRPFAQFDQANLADNSVALRPYEQGSAAATNAAYIGDGSDPSYLRDQNELMTEPGYSIGTGAARTR